MHVTSNRPFLPSTLSGNMLEGIVPLGGSNRLPRNPNPLAQLSPLHTVKADASGIQQAMAKRAGVPGSVPQAPAAPAAPAMPYLNQYLTSGGVAGAAMGRPPAAMRKALAAPSGLNQYLNQYLKGNRPWQRRAQEAAGRPPEAMRKAPAASAAAFPWGHAMRAAKYQGMRGGFGLGGMPAAMKATAKAPGSVPFGKQSAQDNSKPRLSETGSKSGVTFKYDDQGHCTGAEAFDTLDGYMKKAGLNSFQTQFFTRLVQSGFDQSEIRACVKTANDRFGEKIGNELTEGLVELEKVGFAALAMRAVPAVGRFLFGQGARQAVKKAPAVARQVLKKAPEVLKKAPEVLKKAPDVARQALKQAPEVLKKVPDVARQALKQAPEVLKKVPAAVRQVPGAVKNFGKGLTTKGQLPRAGEFGEGVYSKAEVAGNAIRNMAGNAAKAELDLLKQVPGAAMNVARAAPGAGRRLLTGPGARGQLATGAASGALNPYTGLGSGNIIDEDGFHGGRLLASTLGGAALGRIPGAQNMMRRGLAGEGFGFAGGYGAQGIGHLTGNETLQNVDPLQMARLGYAAGGASAFPGLGRGISKIPGVSKLPQGVQRQLQNIHMKGTTKALTNREPFHLLMQQGGKGLNWAKQNKALAGGLGMGGYLANQIPNKMDQFKDETLSAIDTAKNDMQDQAHGYMEHYDPQIQQALSSANQASEGVNNLTERLQSGEGGGLMSGLFGEGGVGGMMGGIGDYMKKNPWLIPVLLGGLGAGGGYAMGGGGGAALGGIGAPLLYALMSGQFNQNSNAEGTPPAAPSAAPSAAPPAAQQDTVAANPVVQAEQLKSTIKEQEQQRQQQQPPAAQSVALSPGLVQNDLSRGWSANPVEDWPD